MRIDGAPTLADFGGFIAQLQQSVAATLQDDKKFARLAKRVLGDDAVTRAPNLRDALASIDPPLTPAQTAAAIGYRLKHLDCRRAPRKIY